MCSLYLPRFADLLGNVPSRKEPTPLLWERSPLNTKFSSAPDRDTNLTLTKFMIDVAATHRWGGTAIGPHWRPRSRRPSDRPPSGPSGCSPASTRIPERPSRVRSDLWTVNLFWDKWKKSSLYLIKVKNVHAKNFLGAAEFGIAQHEVEFSVVGIPELAAR